MIKNISSSKNDNFKHFKALKQKKERDRSLKYTVEGIKSVRDAIDANADISEILVSERFYSESDFSYPGKIDIYVIADGIFQTLSSTETPPGIIAVINQHRKSLPPINPDKPYIYCDNVRDPGNLGTIIRTADAAGFGGVLLSDGCADIYNPKTVRSSMGSFFHIPIFESINADEIRSLKNSGFSVFAGLLDDDTVDYTEADMSKPSIIVVGNEANGICGEIASLADFKVKIPIEGKAESLNVGVAAALLMYECKRQKK